ncbi:MAG: DUF2306 domain-containing protein [Hyphomonadaceae bacterium]|nr:DUF2306 domain-containing protein [Hyphomonadaceae bacterium]
MADAALNSAPHTRNFAKRALAAAGATWFVVALLGQWVFVYYIAGFYGHSIATGNFAEWARHPSLITGYVAGDGAGNLFFAAHIVLAFVLTFSGALQLVPQVRKHAIAFHRWNGRVFLAATLAAAIGGLWLVWLRAPPAGGSENHVNDTAITINGVLIIAFAVLAWRAVRRKDIAAHQNWAMRTYLVTNGVWFLRVGVMAWAISTQGLAMDTFFAAWGFGSYVVPLLVFEAYLHAKRSDNAVVKVAMAGGLFALTALMGAGIVWAYLIMWGPLI